MKVIRYSSILTLLLLAACSNNHLRPIVYSLGDYKEQPFQYPSSLSKSDIDFIVAEIQRISHHPIISIRIRPDYYYDVMTCSEGTPIVGECHESNIYIFGIEENNLANYSITPNRVSWVNSETEEVVQRANMRKYRQGAYSNIPLKYPPSLSKSDIQNIVQKVHTLSNHQIVRIYETDSNSYSLMTCHAGSLLPYGCDTGELFSIQKQPDTLYRLRGQLSLFSKVVIAPQHAFFKN